MAKAINIEKKTLCVCVCERWRERGNVHTYRIMLKKKLLYSACVCAHTYHGITASNKFRAVYAQQLNEKNKIKNGICMSGRMHGSV